MLLQNLLMGKIRKHLMYWGVKEVVNIYEVHKQET
jgi:hypothetical protein